MVGRRDNNSGLREQPVLEQISSLEQTIQAKRNDCQLDFNSGKRSLRGDESIAIVDLGIGKSCRRSDER